MKPRKGHPPACNTREMNTASRSRLLSPFPNSQTLPGFPAVTGLLTTALLPPPQPPRERGLVAPSLASVSKTLQRQDLFHELQFLQTSRSHKGAWGTGSELAELVPRVTACELSGQVPLLVAQEFLRQLSGKPCLPSTRRLRMNSLLHSPLQMQTLTRLDNPRCCKFSLNEVENYVFITRATRRVGLPDPRGRHRHHRS